MSAVLDRCPWSLRWGVSLVVDCDRELHHPGFHQGANPQENPPWNLQRIDWSPGDRSEFERRPEDAEAGQQGAGSPIRSDPGRSQDQGADVPLGGGLAAPGDQAQPPAEPQALGSAPEQQQAAPAVSDDPDLEEIKAADVVPSESGDPRVKYFQSPEDGQWYWERWRSSDIVADGGEGYSRESEVLEAIARENPGLPVAREDRS